MGVCACFEHKVYPHYPAVSAWRPRTPWELVDGRYQRIYRDGFRRRAVRQAVVERSAGGWRWFVVERGPRGRVAMVGRSRKDLVYVLASNAFNPAEVSATTK